MSSVYLVLGAKGGVGTTTVAVDLALASHRMGRITTLVDADLSGMRSMAAILDCAREFNAQRSKAVYAVATIKGMTVLELIDKYDNAFALRGPDLEEVASRVLGYDGMSFIDVPKPFEEIVRPFTKEASRAIVVVEPSLLGVTAARVYVADLARFGVSLSQISLIMNPRYLRSQITARELEKMIGASVLAELPKNDDRNYPKTMDAIVKRLLELPVGDPFGTIHNSIFKQTLTSVSSAPVDGPVKTEGSKKADEAFLDPEERRRNEQRKRIKKEISDEVFSRIDAVAASRAHTDGEKISELRDQISNVITQILEKRDDITLSERAEIQQEVIDEQLGLGPLEDLMRDEKISEIMVNGPEMIYVEKGGRLTLSDATFRDEKHLRRVIERIVTPLGRRIDESSPMVDARLPDGSRVNAIIEPVAIDGSSITIRRFSKKRLGMNDLVKYNSVPQEAVGLLRAMVEAKLNIVVSGGTGSGKTTFLNILSNFIPEEDRIVTIEDAAELSLSQEHVVRLETRPANAEGKGSVSIRDLVRNSLRMRPDRIVIGECRGGEALDMLQAMNTGHDGSLTTLHANTPRDALARLETLVLMAGFDLPIKAIRQQIASAVDAIVQIERLRDGTRKCSSITEVVGMEGEIVTLQELIKWQSDGLDEEGKVRGWFEYSGVQPHNVTRFEENGVEVDLRELSKLKSLKAAW